MGTMTADEMVKIDVCDEYPESRIRQYLEGRDTWTTADILAHEALTSEEKLWMLIRGNFLGAREKVEAACRIAEDVLPLFEEAYPGIPYPRQAIEVARKAAAGEATIADQQAVRTAARSSLLRLSTPEKIPYYLQGAADAATATADPEPGRALRHASTCARVARGDDADAVEIERQVGVIRRVCRR
jgi:hypothetical protein